MNEEEKFKRYLRMLNEENSIDKKEEAMLGLLGLYYKQQTEIEELKKYDYRNIKISEDNKLSSIHFTKEQLDLMNLGIALYINIFKESEDEIEELKEKNASLQKEIKLMKSININDNYISKNEIRKQIRQLEALDKQYYKKVIVILEKLLEE